MTGEAADRLKRLLLALPILAAGDEISMADLERRTGIARATLLDDLRALTERGDEPGGFVESLRVEIERERVKVHASHFLRPMRLTAGELSALELGLAMLRASSPPEEWPAIARARDAIRKLIVQLPAAGTEPFPWHAEPPAASDSAALPVLEVAIAAHRQVQLVYWSSGDTAARERVVSPCALIPARGRWYLAAVAKDESVPRLYRLDRTEGATLLDATGQRPDPTVLERLLSSSTPFLDPDSATMRVRYSPRIARWVAEREHASLGADGSITIDHPMADREWAIRHVLQYGPDAEVLAPATLREEIRRRLTELLS